MKLKELNSELLQDAAEMLKAIAHPVRINILGLLEDKEQLSVSQLHEILNIEQSATSHHLSILKNKGILRATRIGKNTFYSIRQDSLLPLINCICECSVNK